MTEQSFMPEVRERDGKSSRKRVKPWAIQGRWTSPKMQERRGREWFGWRRYETEEAAREAMARFAARYQSITFRVMAP